MNKNITFTRVMADDDNEYICPMDLAKKNRPLRVEELDDCVEADVVGRYIGQLKMEEDDG